MQLSEIIRRAEKELSTATRNLETAKRRSAPEQDVRNLEEKVEYRKAVLDGGLYTHSPQGPLLNSGPCGLCVYNPPSSTNDKPCCVCPADF